MTESEAIEWQKSFKKTYKSFPKDVDDACDMAINALEKQKAKKVIDNMPTDDDVWYQCPTCKGDLTNIRGFHCPYCGQKLDWSDEQ